MVGTMDISQSFLKAWRKYIHGDLCGHIIHHCYILGKYLPPTKVMKVGIYFEFCLTGALPKDGKIPAPEWMKSGKDLMEPYRKARNDAKYIKEMIQLMGLKIISFGHNARKGRFTGTIDLIVEATRDIVLGGFEIKAGEQIIIDLKYSGLLEDYRSEMGWQFTDKQKEYHKVQAIHYHMIEGKRFFYWVVDSGHKEKDDNDKIIPPPFQIFHTPIDKFMVEQHKLQAYADEEKFNIHKEVGFTPRPVFEDCVDCPIREGCKDKAILPSVKVIDLNIE